MTFLAFGLMDAGDLFVHSIRIYLIAARKLGQTQKWTINGYLEAQIIEESLALNLQISTLQHSLNF